MSVRIFSYTCNNCWTLQPMGWTSEMVAETYHVSRAKQDRYALISHTRATEVSATTVNLASTLKYRPAGSKRRHLQGRNHSSRNQRQGYLAGRHHPSWSHRRITSELETRFPQLGRGPDHRWQCEWRRGWCGALYLNYTGASRKRRNGDYRKMGLVFCDR